MPSPIPIGCDPDTFFCRAAYGRGPSSTTQSLRSINEVLRPSASGDEFEEDLDDKFVDVEGEDGNAVK
jgi:hypothetical protein